ncbi:hypothetical protein HA402_002203 [Bradysia odoriphaga]|nr:hypothetical protein HA402_002203 [Bradysia odoriphaga]
MFSLFRSKKSPRASPEPEPGVESDNFVMVDDRNPFKPNSQPQTNLYPLVNPASTSTSDNQPQPVHYLQDVPFKLSSDLTEGDTAEAFQMQVDEILAKLTRWNSIEEDYDFVLERSLVSQ